VSHFLISLNIVSSNGYSDFYLRHAASLILVNLSYRPKFLQNYREAIGLERGYSAHSMRATFITTALDNGASLEDVQSAAGHADPSTTKLYDRRGYNPEKSASFFANY
jgi:integrase